MGKLQPSPSLSIYTVANVQFHSTTIQKDVSELNPEYLVSLRHAIVNKSHETGAELPALDNSMAIFTTLLVALWSVVLAVFPQRSCRL